MTGNVAQAIVEREDWDATLRGIHGSQSQPDGRPRSSRFAAEQTVRLEGSEPRSAGVVLRIDGTGRCRQLGTQARLIGRIGGVAGVAIDNGSGGLPEHGREDDLHPKRGVVPIAREERQADFVDSGHVDGVRRADGPDSSSQSDCRRADPALISTVRTTRS